jgi:hypothetical protein
VQTLERHLQNQVRHWVLRLDALRGQIRVVHRKKIYLSQFELFMQRWSTLRLCKRACKLQLLAVARFYQHGTG